MPTRTSKRDGARRWVAVWGRAARRPFAAVGVIVASALALMLAITAAAGVPEPEVHDELTMVTMADIFAHGRLCDPTHPHWQHFEANYLLALPCAQGKYPPGPPLYMALGRALTGQFIAGVWISVVVMILASAYAMYGWLPARWALLGTVLVALRFGVAGDWAQSYWGGSVAAAGGALVFGAMGRLTTLPAARDAALLGAGLMMLAFSRPYEGLMFSLPAVVLLALRLLRPWPARARLWRAMPAMVAVATAGLGWLMYYNASITGSPLVLPYTLYEQTHTTTPLFVFQEFRPEPSIRHAQMSDVERYLVYEAHYGRRAWPWHKITATAAALWDFVKPALAFAAVGLVGLRKWRGARLLAGLSLATVFAAGTMVSPATAQRYLAPATIALMVLMTIGLAGLTRRRVGLLPGGVAAALIVITSAGAVLAAAAVHIYGARTSSEWWAAKRDIREGLLRSDGDDLVFVHYEPGHPPHQEWVYNGAGIDSQPIVWARQMGAHEDARLRRYFNGRKAWVVLVDASPPRLVPWQTQQVAEYSLPVNTLH